MKGEETRARGSLICFNGELVFLKWVEIKCIHFNKTIHVVKVITSIFTDMQETMYLYLFSNIHLLAVLGLPGFLLRIFLFQGSNSSPLHWQVDP